MTSNKKCFEHFGKLPFKNKNRATSQLAAAEKYIRENRDDIAYVTIDIGANDVASCAAGGKLDVKCVTEGIARIKKYVPEIAKRLRAAAGKDVPIAGMTFYNPFLQQWFTNPGLAEATVGIAKAQVNDALTKIYKKQKFKVADVGTAFGTYKPFSQTTTYNGRAGVPVAVANICKYSWMCAAGAAWTQHPRHEGRLHGDHRHVPEGAGEGGAQVAARCRRTGTSPRARPRSGASSACEDRCRGCRSARCRGRCRS